MTTQGIVEPSGYLWFITVTVTDTDSGKPHYYVTECDWKSSRQVFNMAQLTAALPNFHRLDVLALRKPRMTQAGVFDCQMSASDFAALCKEHGRPTQTPVK